MFHLDLEERKASRLVRCRLRSQIFFVILSEITPFGFSMTRRKRFSAIVRWKLQDRLNTLSGEIIFTRPGCLAARRSHAVSLSCLKVSVASHAGWTANGRMGGWLQRLRWRDSRLVTSACLMHDDIHLAARKNVRMSPRVTAAVARSNLCTSHGLSAHTSIKPLPAAKQ